MGRFTMAAKHHQSIAEMYENEAIDLERAVQHYEQAADYFRGEESNSSANKCLLKVAQYAAQLENYEKAIQIYEQVIIEFRTFILFPSYEKLRTHQNTQFFIGSNIIIGEFSFEI